jgi:hypothetical protein
MARSDQGMSEYRDRTTERMYRIITTLQEEFTNGTGRIVS